MALTPDEPIRWTPPPPLEAPDALASPWVAALGAHWLAFREAVAEVDPELDEKLHARMRTAVGLSEDLANTLDQDLSVPMLQRVHMIATRDQTAARAVAADGSFRYVPFPYGKLKDKPNSLVLDGKTVQEFCPPADTPAALERMIALHGAIPESMPEVRTAWLVNAFLRVHPFVDGNGRTARVLANWNLRRAGLPSLWSEQSERGAGWADALDAAALTHDLTPLVRLVGDQLDRAVSRLVLEAEEPPRGVDLATMTTHLERQTRLAARVARPTVDSALLVDRIAAGLAGLAAPLPGASVRLRLEPQADPATLARTARRSGLITRADATGGRVQAIVTRGGAEARLTVCSVPFGTLGTGATTVFARVRPRGPVVTGITPLHLLPTERTEDMVTRVDNWVAEVAVAAIGILHRLL